MEGKGIKKGIFTSLQNLMKSEGWSLERAMAALGIPVSEKSQYGEELPYDIVRRLPSSLTPYYPKLHFNPHYQKRISDNDKLIIMDFWFCSKYI